jgi:hypothetical protein
LREIDLFLVVVRTEAAGGKKRKAEKAQPTPKAEAKKAELVAEASSKKAKKVKA